MPTLPTVLAAALAAGLLLATLLVHFFLLYPALQALVRRGWTHAPQLLAGSLLIVLAHLFEAAIYAAGFACGAQWGLGGFEGVAAMQAADYFYFSLINYNTLGLGAIYPTQTLRLVAGVEALNGFLLISCSASFIHALLTQRGFARRADACA